MGTSWYGDFATDATASAVLSADYINLWGAVDSFISSPQIRWGGNDLGGSKVKRVTHYGSGSPDLMGAVAEGTDATPTAMATAHTDVTIARYVIARDRGDLAQMTNKSGVLASAAIAQNALNSFTYSVVNAVASVASGFATNTPITASSTLTMADMVDAQGALDGANCPSGYLFLLHPVQWAQVRKDILSVVGGSQAFDPATPELVRAKGPGYQGKFNGSDVFTSNTITTNAGKYRGVCLANDAIVWATGIPPVPSTGGILLGNELTGQVLFEEQRKSLAGTSLLVGSAYFGVSIGAGSRGVSLRSDA